MGQRQRLNIQDGLSESSAPSADVAGTGVPVGCPVPENSGIVMSLVTQKHETPRLVGTAPPLKALGVE